MKTRDRGSRTKDEGPRTKDEGPRTKEQGRRTREQGRATAGGGPGAADKGPASRSSQRKAGRPGTETGQCPVAEVPPGRPLVVIVVGCGRVGAALADHLSRAGYAVTVVDQAAEAFRNLPPDFVGRMVQGDALARDALRRAGIEKADALAAVTNSDSVNAVVGHVARTEYHLARVVVRNYDPAWRGVHEAFGLQVVSSASWGAQRIEELLSDASLRVVFSAGNAEVEIYELQVPAAWQGRCLQELLPAENCQLAALARAGRAMLPGADLPLEGGDVLYVSATAEGIAALRQRMAASQED